MMATTNQNKLSASSLSAPHGAILNCDQIVTVADRAQPFLVGPHQDQPSLIERSAEGSGCCLVWDQQGTIMAVGHQDSVLEQLSGQFTWLQSWSQLATTIDGTACSLVPGLIDSHTHPIWAGDRVAEFDAKLRGATYLDIHNQGGGIHYTVEQTRKASEDTLLASFLERVACMNACGTTVVECKTGYGLNTETELKMLRVIQRARKETRTDLVATFLGAHAVPRGMTSEEGVLNCIEMMQQISALSEAKDWNVEFIDVFCEQNVYDLQQSQRILETGKKLFQQAGNCRADSDSSTSSHSPYRGPDIAFHGDELADSGSAQLAAQLHARSISHMEYSNSTGIGQMGGLDGGRPGKVAAILCPTTCYLLRLPKPSVRTMIGTGVPVVIATDYNPNAMCYSLPMAMNLAAVHYGMSVNECLVATTLNAAYALKREHSHGSLEVGKQADCVLINAPDWRHLIYQFGDTRTLIKAVVKRGERI